MYSPHHPPTRRSRSAGWLPLAALLLASSAWAQEAAAPPEPAPEAPKTPEAPEDAPPSEQENEGSIQLPSAFGSVQVGGRLSVREAIDAKGSEALAGKLSLPAARIELTYQWKKRLRAVVELDVTDGLKDAYAWLKLSKGFSLRAGQFKVPLSLVELESASKLPLVRRGLGRDVLSDGLGLTGRRLGAQLEWKCSDCDRTLKLRAGVWQSGENEEVALENGLGLIPAVRGTWAVLDSLELGASAQVRPPGTSTSGTWSNWTAGFDAKHTLAIAQGELRTWAEVLVGRSDLLVGAEGPLLTARALTAWRIGSGSKGALYVEPFVMLSALDPDLQLQKDLLWEAAGGLNFGQWRRWRLQAQVESRRTEPSVPASLKTLDKSLTARRALMLQMEVNF
ncbi:OprO/OprP family phosphate-selective porin [Archangium lipolyticum]|uniref:OprO/OprP family phosphate-selective porin n=1 Tax=Archangium lipolyticum TaxID=2970465 RepID=UPI002149EAC4|nr:OprO/OprP family phosphate-selective porin [Archangium lipolyticum]